MVQARDLHTLDDHAGFLGRRAPHHELARAEAGASHAGQVLHDLERVPLRPGNLARLLGADAGLDCLLLDAGGTHDDFLVDVVLLLFHEILHGPLLAGMDGFVGYDGDEGRVANLDLVGGGR